jgi:single-stranded-DNA-specific exonuclease
MPLLDLEAIESSLKTRFNEGFLTLKDLPHPSTFKDMTKATKRIVEAIQNREPITLIGDYDVDGIVSTTLIRTFFHTIDYPLHWMIPNRFKDGYGLSKEIVSRLEPNQLVITVDNGIAAWEAAEYCNEKNITLIITDHHIVGDRVPKAYAIVNQKQEMCKFPYKEICGAQIAWYLMASLKRALNIEFPMQHYLGLVSIAIIADMMPLKHINRGMYSAGVKVLNRGQIPAIKAFFESIHKTELNEQDIGFGLAPLLNATGRMKDASMAVDFLFSTNIYEARQKLIALKALNEERKTIENQITLEVKKQVNRNESVIVVKGENWHEGVIGIVAARVARTFQKPTIVLTKVKGSLYKGSGRSFGACHLFHTVQKCKHLLEKFGGHKEAIGVSIKEEHIVSFKEMLQENYKVTETLEESDILGELSFETVNEKLLHLLKQYAPYGVGNPVPKFISRHVTLQNIVTMGQEGNHKRLLFQQEDTLQSGVKFRCDEAYKVGEVATVVYEINENQFNGKITLQLLVESIEIV